MFTPARKVILGLTIAMIVIFSIRFLALKNYEFIGYIAVIILATGLLVSTMRRVAYPDSLLWLLFLWGLMHLAGGGIPIGDGHILYQWMIIPFSATAEFFRYDQLVHMIGFGAATYLVYALIRPYIATVRIGPALAIVIVMAGLGVGAFNEIVEFFATVILPETGVGGYVNTSLDLVADGIGALIATLLIARYHHRELAKHNS